MVVSTATYRYNHHQMISISCCTVVISDGLTGFRIPFPGSHVLKHGPDSRLGLVSDHYFPRQLFMSQAPTSSSRFMQGLWEAFAVRAQSCYALSSHIPVRASIPNRRVSVSLRPDSPSWAFCLVPFSVRVLPCCNSFLMLIILFEASPRPRCFAHAGAGSRKADARVP